MVVAIGPMRIRDATDADCDRIAAIWNPVIRDTAFTFTTEEKTPEGLRAMLAAKRASGHPFLVVETAGEVTGFATYGQFRAGPGYAGTMEHTVICAEAARGRGAGRALMAALEARARACGVRILVAGVSADNPAGIAFHARIGFAEVARLPGVGWKWGRARDLVLMQKTLLPGKGLD